MWTKPWKLAEGAAIGGGLIVVGLVLQFTVGPINWSLLAYPFNAVLLLFYLLALTALYVGRRLLYPVEWTMSVYAAVPAIAYCVIVTLALGLSGWDEMLHSWPFVLIYIWLMSITSLITLRRLLHLRRGSVVRNLTFLCNHLGLFMAMVCGTLGHADMQRLRLTARIGQPEWRAVDTESQRMPPAVVELPLAIELHHFTIEEYPPRYVIISNETGRIVDNAPWTIRQDTLLEYAAIVYGTRDSLGHQNMECYVEWPSMGACTAAYVTATRQASDVSAQSPVSAPSISGWVSCGSFMFPYKALRLDSLHSVVMPEREPKRYASDISVYTENNEKLAATIEVNKPLEVDGWKIYQLSYDEKLGRWSDTSVFELVRDPWLPYVYTGIILMLVGGLFIFLTAGRSKEESPLH